ncbi:hypothetical protein Q0Z83_101600 [Actinoplanes sichuanensis]|nr:hypothetical protein Q0Z83_101600 [Actinoplanes sichuanensis]
MGEESIRVPPGRDLSERTVTIPPHNRDLPRPVYGHTPGGQRAKPSGILEGTQRLAAQGWSNHRGARHAESTAWAPG